MAHVQHMQVAVNLAEHGPCALLLAWVVFYGVFARRSRKKTLAVTLEGP